MSGKIIYQDLTDRAAILDPDDPLWGLEGYTDEDDAGPRPVEPWRVPWPHIKSVDVMWLDGRPDYTEIVCIKAERFATWREAYSYFSAKYNILATANTARYWAVVIKRKETL